MIQLIYNGTFEGLLTAIYEVYDRKLSDVKIIRQSVYQPDLLSQSLTVIADTSKAERVWKGLKKKLSTTKRNEVYKTFLSEQPAMEEILYGFIKHVFAHKESVEQGYAFKPVLAVSQTARQVHREKHRMEAFVRFQKTKDDLYFAIIEPDFNVLPLIVPHFKDRYADQHWIIYDRLRDYGIQYDKTSGAVTEIQMQFTEGGDEEFLPASVCAEDEGMYQSLWKSYFTSVNIGARKNTKLHVRHVPTRYWRFLTEKRVDG